MIPVSGEAVAWAKECLGAGDPPDEVATALGLSEEQLLCAAGVRMDMTSRQREAVTQYAAGTPLVAIARAMGSASAHGATAYQLVESARARGFVIPRRRPRPGGRA